MNWVQLFSLLAFVVLVIITVVRMPSVIRQPSSRLAWLATLSGCAAFAMTGAVIPLSVLDAWLGGTNLGNLFQNVFATTAFWFLMQAARTVDGSRVNPRSWWVLPAMVVAFSIPFLMIPSRGPTSNDFIKQYADEVTLWVYASVYMGCVVFIMWRLLAGIRGRTPRPYVLIRVGAWAIGAASVLEIAYLTLRVLDVQPRAAVELIGHAFVLPFYGGVILAAIGLAAFAFVRRTRWSVLVALRVLLLRANTERGLDPRTVHEDGADAYDTYRLAVRLTDIANSEELNWRERWILRAATRMLDRQMSAPTVVRMSGRPEVVRT